MTCPPSCKLRNEQRSGLCICCHVHLTSGPCDSGRGKERCPCEAYAFNLEWQWHWSHPAMRDDLDAGGDLHHAVISSLWQLLTFDHDWSIKHGQSQLSDEQRPRLRRLAADRIGELSTHPFDLSSSIGVPYAFVMANQPNSLAVARWLDQPLDAAAWYQRHAEAERDRERTELAAAVSKGTYAGPAKQAVLL